MPARKYDEDTATRAAEMVEAGHPVREIARRLDMTVSSVDYHALRLGAYSPRPPAITSRPAEYTRNGYTVRPFSEDEDARLLAMEADGLTVAEIAARLGRKKNSTLNRLRLLARREARMEALL